ncbi:hypothetical protein [Sphingopyxis sp.]|uniref:hypothetical protein n=1 Tax=Sphingopyxis sp. TaxID=1908224 RepID=UPI001DC82AF2|nr:hypothetical protein [Sphingopyxis sp.]MBW8297803.1 hypothetical protein [Sphingopyxis sp.]
MKTILFEEFEDALAPGTMYWKEMGGIDEIIFGGRYARGGRVDDPALVWVCSRIGPLARLDQG